MPIYEYRCEKCGHTFDKFVRSISSVVQVECPECHSTDCKKAISLFGTATSARGSSLGASCTPSGG